MNEDMPIIGMGWDSHLHTNQKDKFVHSQPGCSIINKAMRIQKGSRQDLAGS